MNARLVLAAGDILSSPVFCKRYRGKAAKEIYRCGKGIAFTGSLGKPIAYVLISVPRETYRSVTFTAVGNIGEAAIGYVSGIGFIRYFYKVIHPAKLKASARLLYNIGCFPITLYSKGIGRTFDLLGISKLETYWFGLPVYLFDDNRLWAEKNFILTNVFEGLEGLED
jgi:hypothetical protein